MNVTIGIELEKAIDQIQEKFLLVYGSYDLHRSIIWMVEELGEVVSAIRKNKSLDDIEGELGDLLAWIFCLGNILNINVSKALTGTFDKEVNRQFREYGALKYASIDGGK